MKKILLGLLLTNLISCSNTNDQPQKPQEDLSYIQDSINKYESTILARKYNASSGWDTTETFSYQLQERFDAGSRIVAFTGRVIDIIKKDTNYILKVDGDYSESNYFAEIVLPQNEFNGYNETLFSKLHPRDGRDVCFILKNVKVRSTHFLTTDSKIDDPIEGEEPSSYLNYDFGGTLFIFKGDLADFYLYKDLVTEK